MKPTLCCIEPSLALRQVIVQLAQETGWQIVACADLAAAQSAIGQTIPDLITTAAVLPGGDFEQVVAWLRASPQTETLPVVMLAAQSDSALVTRAIEAGVTEIFQKDDLTAFQAYLETFSRTDTDKTKVGGKHALVLDDDHAVGQYIGAILGDMGLRVSLFQDKPDALAAALTTAFDIVITDLVLGEGKSGNSFIRLLRHSDGKSAVAPIIAISGFADDARRIEALRSGANLYLDKPVIEAELRFQAARLLQSTAVPNSYDAAENAMLCGAELFGLSEREQLICGLVGVGYTDKDIARQLGISYWTVRTHLGRIFRKCRVANRVELGNVLRRNIGADNRGLSEAHAAVMDWLSLAAHVMDTLQYGLVVTDEDHVILRVNPAFTRITGYTADEAIGLTPQITHSGQHRSSFYHAMHADLTHKGYWSGEIWNRHKNGQLYLAWLDIRRLPAGMPLGARFVGVLADITERFLENERIRHDAQHDVLTGLANRSLFREQALREIARTQRHGGMFACLFIDLDRFKPINDTQGHECGDRVLQEVARRLTGVIRNNDILARFGGDEFVALAPDLANQPAALALGRKVLAVFDAPIVIDGTAHAVGASVGISLFPADADNIEALVAAADAAMYRAKAEGGQRVCFHEPALERASDDRRALEQQLRQALDCGEFELWFQPRYALADQRIVGAEALLRWMRPGNGPVSPQEFMPIAENSGLIVSLGDWVLREACRVLQQIHARGHGDFSMAINVSPQQIARSDFAATVAATLSASGVGAEHLQLEIAATSLRDPQRASGAMQRLTQTGVTMTLDNFGDEQASLASLKQFPFDTVKVDRKFVSDIHTDRYRNSFARAILELANGLDMKMAAGGVENSEQAACLKDIGCHHVQGFLFGKPMPENELLALLIAKGQQ